MEKTFAYFPLSGVLLELYAEHEQIAQFARAGYEQVFAWGQAVAGEYVRLIVLSLPEVPSARLLSKVDFPSLCRRAIAAEGKKNGQQQRLSA